MTTSPNIVSNVTGNAVGSPVAPGVSADPPSVVAGSVADGSLVAGSVDAGSVAAVVSSLTGASVPDDESSSLPHAATSTAATPSAATHLVSRPTDRRAAREEPSGWRVMETNPNNLRLAVRSTPRRFDVCDKKSETRVSDFLSQTWAGPSGRRGVELGEVDQDAARIPDVGDRGTPVLHLRFGDSRVAEVAGASTPVTWSNHACALRTTTVIMKFSAHSRT